MPDRCARRSPETIDAEDHTIPVSIAADPETTGLTRQKIPRKRNGRALISPGVDRSRSGEADATIPKNGRRTSSDRERARADKEQVDFLANLSHDLRSPLTSLREFVSIVEEGLAGPVNDRQREYLGIALRNADAIAEMTEHLLVLTKIQEDKFRLDRRRVDLAQLLGDHTLTHGYRPKDKVVTFRVDVSPKLPDAYADPDRLLEAVRNLVDNAIKYSGETVTIAIQAREARGQMLMIQVRDTGFGMDPVTRRNLFVRSYRGRHARRKSPGGLGLGLSIVKEIMDLHDGKITVRSRLNEGTDFRLLLPQFDAGRVLLGALRDMWEVATDRGQGFAFVRAGIRESQGALSPSPEETVHLVREVLRKTLGPEDTLLPDCHMCGAVCFLLTVGRSSARGAVRKILRTVEERLRLQSGTHIEWESKPTWLHSDDFNHLEQMADTILHRWCCMGEQKDAA